jgi:hypothetical protein
MKDINPALRRLKDEGYKVRMHHYRPARCVPTVNLSRYEMKERGLEPLPRGGVTVATIQFPDDGRRHPKIVTATALCSDEDNYSRKVGARIALGRALKNLAREDRG